MKKYKGKNPIKKNIQPIFDIIQTTYTYIRYFFPFIVEKKFK